MNEPNRMNDRVGRLPFPILLTVRLCRPTAGGGRSRAGRFADFGRAEGYWEVGARPFILPAIRESTGDGHDTLWLGLYA